MIYRPGGIAQPYFWGRPAAATEVPETPPARRRSLAERGQAFFGTENNTDTLFCLAFSLLSPIIYSPKSRSVLSHLGGSLVGAAILATFNWTLRSTMQRQREYDTRKALERAAKQATPNQKPQDAQGSSAQIPLGSAIEGPSKHLEDKPEVLQQSGTKIASNPPEEPLSVSLSDQPFVLRETPSRPTTLRQPLPESTENPFGVIPGGTIHYFRFRIIPIAPELIPSFPIILVMPVKTGIQEYGAAEKTRNPTERQSVV